MCPKNVGQSHLALRFLPVSDWAEVGVHVAVDALVAGPLQVAIRVAPVELAVPVPVAPVALLTRLLVMKINYY